jgi:hypothetical protein
MEILNVLKNHGQFLDNHLNLATFIYFQIQISYLLDEICFSEIEVTQKHVLNTDIYYLFIYIVELCIKSFY